MIVEDTGKLKEWLITELKHETIDADANAVASYAVALVKKDLAEDELKPTVCADLSVFLGENTELFVTKLFQVVKDKSYMQKLEEIEEPVKFEIASEAVSRQESKTQDSGDELSDEDRDHRRTVRKSRSNSPAPPTHRVSPHRRLGNRGVRYDEYVPRGVRRGVRSRIGRGGYDNGRRYNSGPLGQRRRSRSPRRSLSPRSPRSPRPNPAMRKSLSPVRRSRSPLDLLSTLDAKSSKREVKQRCRDYDEKGYCLSGELCPFSHGNDAVVMKDVASLNLASTSSTQAIKPTPTPNQGQSIQRIVSNVPAIPVEPYNPEVPRMWPPPMNSGANMAGPPNYMMGQRPPNRYPRPPPQQMMPGPRMRPMRPDPRQMYRPRYPPSAPYQQPIANAPPLFDPLRATLEVKNLPPEFNNITKLNEHFSKFGEIINLQVQYMSQPDTALITFSSNKSAQQAHQNPEPVFNNRFIKIFWHTNSNKQADMLRPSAKSRLGIESHPPAAKPAPKPKVEPNLNRATLRLDNSAPAKNPPAEPSSKRIVEQKKRSLMLKYLADQKTLVKLAENSTNPKKKAEYLKTIKQLLATIEQLKSSETTNQKASKAAKEMLDTELDIHQKTKAGEDTALLQTKLESLKREAQSLGIKPARGRGPPPHTQPPKPSLPTAIVVMGFKVEEKDAVIKHFCQFGQVTDKEFVEGPVTSVVVEYSKANDAQVAATHGTKFGQKTLILKWYKGAKAEAHQPSAARTSLQPQADKPASVSVSATTSSLNTPSAPASSVDADEDKVLEGDINVVRHDSVLDDEGDLLAAGEGNDEGEVDEALLLGEEDGEDDTDDKRVW